MTTDIDLFPAIPVEVLRGAIPLAESLNVSPVARLPGGIVSKLLDAKGDISKLPEADRKKRAQFLARMMGEMRYHRVPLWQQQTKEERDDIGPMPTRAHLSLICWGYSPAMDTSNEQQRQKWAEFAAHRSKK